MSSCLCDNCSALCCRYFVLEIDTPETRRQFDDVRWYLLHENTFVFIEKKKWYLGIYARCKQLMPDNRCGVYEKRPKICRQYSADNCDYHGGEYNWEVLFSSAEQLERYAEEQLKQGRHHKKKKRAKVEKEHSSRRRRPSVRVAAVLAGEAKRRLAPSSNGNGRARVSLPVVRP